MRRICVYCGSNPGNRAIYAAAARSLADVLVRHEQGAVHAAEGYARSTGKVGVVLVTSGPGATNAVTGIATAGFSSAPGGLRRPRSSCHVYTEGGPSPASTRRQLLPFLPYCQD